jgi:hypothetical protein
MARRGRKPKTKDQKLKDALERNQPADYILARRKLFSFVQPPSDKRQDGRNGEIDSEVCDAIGQLCALGLLDGHGYDPVELRDKGRFWGCGYAKRMKMLGPRTGAYEPRSRSTNASTALTGEDLLFDRMNEALGNGFERSALLSLVVDPLIGHRETVPWAQMFIDDELFKRGRFHAYMVAGGVNENDRMLLAATIRGLCALVEGALPGRYERKHAA